jgi:hypothetical protein
MDCVFIREDLLNQDLGYDNAPQVYELVHFYLIIRIHFLIKSKLDRIPFLHTNTKEIYLQ